MTDEHGEQFEDSITVAFNVHAYRLVKWTLALPFLVAALLAVASLAVGADTKTNEFILKF